jgi:hypothetical protein
VLPPDAVVAADGAIVLPKDSAVTIDPDLTVASSGGEDLERATVNASDTPCSRLRRQPSRARPRA